MGKVDLQVGNPVAVVVEPEDDDLVEVLDDDVPAGVTAGVTAVQPSVLVLRVLAGRVEPAMALLAKVRAAWRLAAWQLQANPPRVWRC